MEIMECKNFYLEGNIKMEDAVKEITYKGYIIRIHQDDCPENPIKEWDMLGKFIC